MFNQSYLILNRRCAVNF